MSNNMCDQVSESSKCGRLALIRQGQAYYRLQMEKAVQDFRPFISLEDSVSSETTSDDDEMNDDSLCDNDLSYYNSMTDSEDENISDVIIDDDDTMNRSLITNVGSMLASQLSFSTCHVEDTSGIMTVFLPSEYCQNKLDGANGSNACVLISLIMGYMYVTENCDPVSSISSIVDRLLPLFCGAIHVGNYLHSESGFTGMLHIEEALALLPPELPMELVEETNLQGNVTLDGSIFGYYKTVHSMLDKLSFTVLIIGMKAFCLCKYGNLLIGFDSHEHEPFGSKIFIIRPDVLTELDLACYEDVEIAYACIASAMNR